MPNTLKVSASSSLVISPKGSGSISFLGETDGSFVTVIGLFLAVLELCRDHKIWVKQNRDFGDLELEKVEINGK